MQIRISKANLPVNLTLAYIIMLGLLDSITNIFLPNGVRIILCCAGMLVLVFQSRLKIEYLPCDVIFFLSIVVFSYQNYYIEIGNSFGFLRYFYVFLLYFVARSINNFPDRIIRYIGVFSLIHVFATIWLKFDSGTYRNLIVPMFDSVRQRLLLSHYGNGWIPGLANHYSSNGMYLSVAVIFLFSSIMCTKKENTKMRVLFVLSLIALLFTGKRAHAIFSLGTMLIIYYVYSANHKHGRLFKIIAISAIIVGGLYIGYGLFPDLFSFIGRFEETAAMGDVTQGRFTTWAAALGVFQDNPLFGIGWSRFSTVAESYGVTINAHNVYVQLLCENGIVGFGIFVALFIWMLTMTVVLFSRMRKGLYECTENDQRNMAFSLGIQTFFVLYCFTGNPLYDAPMFIPYYVALAITAYYKCQIKRN